MGEFNEMWSYAELVKDAKLDGGPEEFKQKLMKKGIVIGKKMCEREEENSNGEFGKGLLIGCGMTLLGSFLYEPCKSGIVKLKDKAVNFFEERKSKTEISDEISNVNDPEEELERLVPGDVLTEMEA